MWKVQPKCLIYQLKESDELIIIECESNYIKYIVRIWW